MFVQFNDKKQVNLPWFYFHNQPKIEPNFVPEEVVFYMALPPRDQRHQYLRYEGLQYTNADIVDFKARLARIYRRECTGCTNLQAGGAHEDKDEDFRRSPYKDKDTEVLALKYGDISGITLVHL
ncbi:hypothetical protein Tco_1394950 [Tanacetum coccineum]